MDVDVELFSSGFVDRLILCLDDCIASFLIVGFYGFVGSSGAWKITNKILT